MNVRQHNRKAWDRLVESRDQWTVPVGSEAIREARHGDWTIVLTPIKPVPHDWLPPLAEAEILCLASGGGQQAPILAAAGARVTVLDNSPKQLEQDQFVARREGLKIRTVEGDMADLSAFPDASFDAIVHPVSNLFVPDVRPVWREAFRVLRPGGTMIAGFNNPARYIFEDAGATSLEVKHNLPYSDVVSLSDVKKRQNESQGIPFEFSHSLEEQIGGQLSAGFVITGLYEDRDRDAEGSTLSRHMPIYIATRASKPL